MQKTFLVIYSVALIAALGMISHFSLDQKFEQLPETPDNHYSLEADNSSTLLENNRDSIPALQEILIDITSSIVYWKGTKLRRTGKHEGTIKVSRVC